MFVDWDDDDGDVEWVDECVEASGNADDEEAVLGTLADGVEADPGLLWELDPEVRETLLDGGWLSC